MCVSIHVKFGNMIADQNCDRLYKFFVQLLLIS